MSQDAGANLGNLDVFLASLQKYAPEARVIVMVERAQRAFAERLGERFPLEAVLEQPVTEADLAPQVAALDARYRALVAIGAG